MFQNEVFLSLLPLLALNLFVIITCLVFSFLYPKRKSRPDVTDRMHASFVGLYLREYWYWLTDPLISLFKILRFTPNTVTFISLLLAFVSAWLYFKGNFGAAGWVLILSGTLDILDGALARQTNQITKEGAFFDSCVDRFSEGAIFMAIALYFRNDFFMLTVCILALLGSELVSYVKARGETVGVTTRAGLMQRAERVFLLSFVSLLQPFFALILGRYGYNPDAPMMITMFLMAVLTLYTVVVRTVILFRGIRKLNRQDG